MLFKAISNNPSYLICKMELDIEFNNAYGMISDVCLVAYLKSKEIVCLVNEEESIYANLVYALDVCVYMISNEIIGCCEANSSLSMISSEKGFWVADETEYKIETNRDAYWLENIINSILGDYSFSKINEYHNYERYIKYDCNDHQEYIAILGKKMLPSYYKSKKRLICLDNKHGIIYGISYTHSKPLTKRLEHLHQIEIEYWSNLRPVNECRQTIICYERFFDLIHFVESSLSVEYTSLGRTKIQWLEGD